MILLVLFFFILGTTIGSFLNVVADRSVKRQSLMGRSYCDWCKARLSAFELIPIASFIALGARCKKCKRPISWQYPLVEALTGFLFVLTFLYLAAWGVLGIVPLVYYLIVVCILIVVGTIDLKHYLIPTTLTLAGSLIALFYNYFFLSSGDFVGHVIAAFAAAIFFAVIVILTLGRGMGEGDIFLAFLIGMVLGIKSTIVAIFIGFVVGALVALILIALGRKRFGQVLAFGPFLVFGFLVSLYWGEFLLNWYLMLY